MNGNMIWDGQALAAVTRAPVPQPGGGHGQGRAEHLSDSAGNFADLQADNDIAGPLIEAMYSLATADHQAFAAHWLLANASAAGADGNVLGEYGRFFDGPPPDVLTTAWQTGGGIWQNMSSPAQQQPDQVLFAWRWPGPGHHVIAILPAQYDREEGGSFFEMSGYMLVP